jgi:hypothetical protein
MVRNWYFHNIMKFKLPPSIPLMSEWHHTQFKELLVMAENFGMFQFPYFDF